MKINSGESVYKLILANKSDLEERAVTDEQIKQLEEETGIECMLVSAKTRANIE